MENKYLIAVSGGVDSMVLLDLCLRFRLSVKVAHCNFALRGEDSDKDEDFIKTYCIEKNIPCFIQSFPLSPDDTAIEEQARKYRYEWFHKCLTEQKTDYILTAHHSDDNIETILMNFFRGTGLFGMTGIPYHNGKIIRPLLYTDKSTLYAFAREYKIPFREDSTNRESNFTRNFLRNEVLPLMEKRIPKVRQNILDNRRRFEETCYIYNQYIQNIRKKLWNKKGELYKVSIKTLKKFCPLSTWLYELFKDFGLSARQVSELQKLLQSVTGKYILTSTHRLLNHNGDLFIIPLSVPNADKSVLIVENVPACITLEKEKLTFKKISVTKNFVIPTNLDIACLDMDKLVFPLLIRRRQEGDYFYPLGMKKKKKLSRLFIDLKYSLWERENIWVLESAKKIVWVVGVRIDNRVKITDNTKNILQVTILPYE